MTDEELLNALSAKLDKRTKERDFQCRKRVEALEELWRLQRKLEEVQAALQVEKVVSQQHLDWYEAAMEDVRKAVAETSRGKIAMACPNCLSRLIKIVGENVWLCATCDHNFTEPAYYQRVKGPAAT